jgi:16S rRNA (adenine1518-N6/adenine1519-N6)-dimethyltransferase
VVPRPARRRPDESWPRPRKRLGQHFLNDPQILGDIADALAPGSADTVVEIGPGRGALTALLAARAARVSAVELDTALADRLRATYAGDPRVTVHHRDVLDAPLAEFAGTDDFLVAGNVPYYITTPILFHALRTPRARRAVFLVQREVADRVVAAPGSDAYGALSANIQALIRVEPRPDPVVSDAEQRDFAEFVIAAFGMRRKQMRRVLRTMRGITPEAAERALGEAGVLPDVRPEVLGPTEFATLWRVLGA